MENASKALLIAAAVLIIIVLIGFGVSVLNLGSEAIKQGEGVGDSISSAGKDAADKVDSILDKIGSNLGGSNSKIIPEGAVYNQGSKTYRAGEEMPSEAKSGDKYEYGDFTYNLNNNGWSVKIKGSSRGKTEVGEIVSKINGKPVVDMTETFSYCTQLTTPPTIPESVVNMERTFMGCFKLNPAPSIPSSVKNMYYTFNNCYALQAAPSIPSGVINMEATFKNCRALQHLPIIPSGVTNMNHTFDGCSVVSYNQSTGGTTVIPSTVTLMNYTFYNCKNLEGALSLSSMPDDYDKCLYGTNISMVVGSLEPNKKLRVLNTKNR